MVEDYIKTYKKRPPKAVLSRLSTYILLDDLSDNHPDKMSREEYPIASYQQIGRRFKKNKPRGDSDKPINIELGTVKRPFTTDDGAVWVSDGVLVDRHVEEFEEVEIKRVLYDVLPERDAFIIEQSFFYELSQNEIAELLGIDRSRVSRIQSRSIDYLRGIFRR